AMRRGARNDRSGSRIHARGEYMRRIVGLLLTLVALLFSWSALAAGGKAYVGNFKDNSVSVIDLGTGTVVATVPVSSGPHGMSATPDGRTVYVSGDGSSEVSVIDTAND